MTTQRVISDWMLEQYLLGETDDALRQEIDRRLPNEPGLAERLAALKTHNERFLADYPPRVMAAAIKERARRTHVAKRRFMIPVLAGAGATLALLLVVFIGLPMMTELPCDDLRTDENGVIYYKGLKPSLHVYQKLGQEAVRLQEGEALAPGAVLQVGYLAAGRKYGVLVSVDGRGTVTEHWPESGDEAARLQEEGETRLPFSYELDDAPRFERFFLILSAKPFAKRMALDALKPLRESTELAEQNAPILPEGLELASFLVKKQSN